MAEPSHSGVRQGIRAAPEQQGSALSAVAGSRFARVVAILPIVGNACFAEDELHQIRVSCLSTNVVRENDNAALTGLQADQGVGRLSIVASLNEAVALRAVKDHNPKA